MCEKQIQTMCATAQQPVPSLPPLVATSERGLACVRVGQSSNEPGAMERLTEVEERVREAWCPSRLDVPPQGRWGAFPKVCFIDALRGCACLKVRGSPGFAVLMPCRGHAD